MIAKILGELKKLNKEWHLTDTEGRGQRQYKNIDHKYFPLNNACRRENHESVFKHS